jgi:hypothetical protein
MKWTPIAASEPHRHIGVPASLMEADMTLFTHRPSETASASPEAEDLCADGNAAFRSGRPDPDPISELATIDTDSQDNDPDRPRLARQPGPKPGFGPDPNSEKLEGNPELGIDPREPSGTWQNGPKAP